MCACICIGVYVFVVIQGKFMSDISWKLILRILIQRYLGYPQGYHSMLRGGKIIVNWILPTMVTKNISKSWILN